MIGAVLDNHVFETLIGKYMPILSDHFKKCEIQISVAALPWFLSMYVNTFPLAFSLRVMDCFFLEGPKVLFQIGYVFFGHFVTLWKLYTHLHILQLGNPKNERRRSSEMPR